MSGDLDPDQVARFRERGFMTVDQLVPDAELPILEGIYEQVMRTPVGDYTTDEGGARSVTTEAWTHPETHPELYDLEFVHRSRRIAAALLGADPEELTVGGQLLVKPAGSLRTVPWHQDIGYWSPEHEYRGVAIWIPLDPATSESGCMNFLPGTHRRHYPHLTDESDSAGRLQYIPDLDVAEAVACPLQPGGATIHDLGMVHQTGPNLSAHPRRALSNRFFCGDDRDQITRVIRKVVDIQEDLARSSADAGPSEPSERSERSERQG